MEIDRVCYNKSGWWGGSEQVGRTIHKNFARQLVKSKQRRLCLVILRSLSLEAENGFLFAPKAFSFSLPLSLSFGNKRKY